MLTGRLDAWFARLHLREKLIAFALIVTSIVMTAGGAVVMAGQTYTFRQNLLRTLSDTASIIGKNSASSLNFGDVVASQRVLLGFVERPEITQAGLYDKHGTFFVGYVREDLVEDGPAFPDEPLKESYRFTPASVDFFQPVKLGGEKIGTVFLRSNLKDLYALLGFQLLILAGVFALSLVLAFFLSRYLQRLLSDPILRLKNAMELVSLKKDYAVRARKASNDEIGRLMDGFNLMLGTIQEAERQLKLSKGRAEEASHAKTEFLANMSHEIRTPLSAIIGFAELLDETKLDAEQKEFARTIYENGQLLLALLNDILDVSKIEARELRLEEIEFEPRQVAHSIMKTVRGRAKGKGLELDVTFEETLPRRVKGDPVRLGQILLNLLTNAIKFTTKGRVMLHAGWEDASAPADPEAARLKFSVTDTGMGIPSQKREEIFRAFTQADTSTTRQYGGTGLGLTICRALTSLMGGQIRVESEEGRGSTFIFTVRLGRVDAPQVSAANGKKRTPVTDRARIRALVAEDNPVNRKLIGIFLDKCGCEVDMVTNGREAVEKLKSGKYDVCFLDLNMPVMGGIEAARVIRREIGNDPPIIALTASVMKEDVEASRAAGMNDYITKHLRREELMEKLGRWVRPENGPRPS